MQDFNGDSEDTPAAAVFRCASRRVDSRIRRQPASRPAAHCENDLEAAAAVVGSTLLGGAVWLALVLWLV